MDESGHDAGGLMASARRVLRSVYDLAQTRLELFLVEAQEERVRLFDALLLAVVCGVCALMALAVGTFTLVLLFWEDRALVLVLLTAGYAVAAGITLAVLRRRLHQWQSFAATREQFKKDRECLEGRN